MNYNDINKNFNKYKLKKNNKSMKEICKPKKFKLQPQQKFLSEYFNHKKSGKGILVYHKIGAGKTCTAINMAEPYKRKMNIIVILPAALIGNFRNELRSGCVSEEYISKKSRKKLLKLKPTDKEFKNIIKKSDNKINKYYTIYSYHKFVKLYKKNKIKFKNTLLIVDEIQNMISSSGIFYESLKETIYKSDESFRIILLSATPMFDKPVEIALTLNLLKPEILLPIGNNFNQTFLKIKNNKKGIYYTVKNIDIFKKLINGMVSYYKGAPDIVFPEDYFQVVRCNMKQFQYKSYLTSMSTNDKYIRGAFKNVDILHLPNNFFLGPRMISNITFPNKSIGMNGFSSFKDDKLQIQNISNYSIKFYKIYKKIKKSEGLIFIYSNFKGIGGLKSLITFFKAHGWKDYKTYGEGYKRYAIWSGDQTNIVKEEIKFVFNQKSNSKGSKIKIMFGSPSIKEGVSLLRVEQVHILEPYWNISRMKQIIGRAIRFCSHKDLPARRRYVDIFLYLATYKGVKTIDQYIWSLAKKKYKLISKFEHALKEMSIDCTLFHQRNNNKEEPIICYEK